MASRYIGIMSGTSLDGADAVLVDFGGGTPRLVASATSPFEPGLRTDLAALQATGPDELHRAALAASRLADLYARLVVRLLEETGDASDDVVALGVHGQTVRHRPELGYTIQINAPARVAELTGITVVSDFRSRDVAAGGQGAPLAPAFHAAVFRSTERHRVILNLGGMANITDLPSDTAATVRGWDCGPGNVLLDTWVARHRGSAFDGDGAWAAAGRVIEPLLARLRAEPWFALPPPKSTGRDLFDAAWLDAAADAFPDASPVDVQATLAELTAATVVDAIATHLSIPDEVIVCGGGARNGDLLGRIARRFRSAGCDVGVFGCDRAEAGAIAPEHVEPLAFAWLAMRCIEGQPGNLPAVTGARGLRVLGAIHPR